MPNSWVTHLPHFLDEGGNIPNKLPISTSHMLNAICSFVAYATHFAGEMDEEFPSCFIVFNNDTCKGRVFPCLTIDEKIGWRCDRCQTNGIISGWAGTLWDLTEKGGVLHG